MAIIYVKPKGASGNGVGFRPSTWNYSIQRVSASESGRTDDGTMYVNQICQKVKISLSFKGTDQYETQRILQAFSPEYIDVYYEDDQTGQWTWKTFYTGDRTATRIVWFTGNKRHESVSFDIIER